ncbi:MAG: DNA-protecting protein DprA [Spirochaetia bacterium]|nr:DNA-protecting protein DprA [Spirochaetia bacterium]
MNESPLSLEEAVFLSSLPHRKNMYIRGGWRTAPAPHAPDWTDFLHSTFTGPEVARARAAASRATSLAAGERFSWITWWDAAYPPLLREIFDPPSVLFYRGPLPDFSGTAAEAVVGTREPLPLAREAAQMYVKGLSERYSGDVMIVSGFARGIDREAHLAAVELGLPGIAVLGAGLFHPGPVSNLSIVSRAAEKGAPFTLISEFVPWETAQAYHFPRRNRIIAGLCSGIAVIQAPIKSGALISAAFAMDEGRDVRAFDHPLFPGVLNAGCRKLLDEGATLIELPGLSTDLVHEPPYESPARLTFLEDKRLGRIRELVPGVYLRIHSHAS